MTTVTCKQCLMSVNIPPGTDTNVHTAIGCTCCTEDHHHGEAAAACPRLHDGPCWQGPQSGPKPDGCTVCRPLLILPTAGIHAPLMMAGS